MAAPLSAHSGMNIKFSPIFITALIKEFRITVISLFAGISTQDVRIHPKIEKNNAKHNIRSEYCDCPYCEPEMIVMMSLLSMYNPVIAGKVSVAITAYSRARSCRNSFLLFWP